MTFENAVDTSADLNAATDAPIVIAPPTKAEKLAAIDAKIKRLQEQRYNIENDIVVVKAPKVVELPTVGTVVLFSYGRKTATTNPVLKEGTVVAVKPSEKAESGKTLPAQIKVQTGVGFDAEYVTIYPAQIVTKNEDGSVDEPEQESGVADAS